jgi:hypothetical protein
VWSDRETYAIIGGVAALRSVLGSGRTIVVGPVLVTLGVVLFALGGLTFSGPFSFFAVEGQTSFPVPPVRLGTQQLVGLTVVGVGLLLAAGAAGFRLGVHALAHADDTT